MAQVIYGNVAGELPSLSMEAIAHLRNGLEEAVQLVLRGECDGIEIVATGGGTEGIAVKQWCELARRP